MEEDEGRRETETTLHDIVTKKQTETLTWPAIKLIRAVRTLPDAVAEGACGDAGTVTLTLPLARPALY